MSNHYPIEVLVALAIGTMFLYSYLDRFVQALSDRIVTGVIQGVPVSAEHRSMLLNTRWLPAATAVLAYTIAMAIAWGVIDRNIDAQGVGLFVAVVRFLLLITAVAWVVLGPFWYFHLASILRQAEAD
jgi:hypothetical protein